MSSLGLGRLLGEAGSGGTAPRVALSLALMNVHVLWGQESRPVSGGPSRGHWFTPGLLGNESFPVGFQTPSTPVPGRKRVSQSPFLPKPPRALRPASPSWSFPHFQVDSITRGTYKLLEHLLHIFLL